MISLSSLRISCRTEPLVCYRYVYTPPGPPVNSLEIQSLAALNLQSCISSNYRREMQEPSNVIKCILDSDNLIGPCQAELDPARRRHRFPPGPEPGATAIADAGSGGQG
jgi:hypothetical protein